MTGVRQLGGVISYLVARVAKILGRDPQTIRRKIHTGELPATKWGKEYLVNREDLKKYLMEKLNLPESAAERMLPMPNGAANVTRSAVLSR